jgi:hypothetical protein
VGRDLAKPLALARVAVGVGTWLAPRVGLAVTLLDSDAPESPYLLRLFAAREAALGVVVLASDRKPESLLQIGLVVDALDVAAGLLALRSRSVGRAAGILTGVAAGGFAMGTVACAQARRRT